MIASRLWQVAGWTMLHYLWAGAALGLLAFVVRRRLRTAAANVRYVFALGSLLLLSAAPLVIAVVVAQKLAPLAYDQPLPVFTASLPRPAGVQLPIANSGPPLPAASPAVHVAVPETPTPFSERLHTAFSLAATCLPWLWILGAPMSFALTTAGLLGAERLRRQSRPLEDARITEMCRQLAASVKISYHVGVAICDRIATPILVGILRPMILLPAAALAGWDAQQLEMVLLHELGHVRRYDNLVNLLQRIVESVLFFHPMVWIVSDWVRREREFCCDELVVACTSRPHAYAEILVTLAQQLSQGTLRGPSLARSRVVSSMAERPLLARVRRILKKEEQPMQVSRKMVGIVCNRSRPGEQ
jgi:beta-lactamase regulating signal transducer with metallopeptidase domain